jgi:fumarate hydratase class II
MGLRSASVLATRQCLGKPRAAALTCTSPGTSPFTRQLLSAGSYRSISFTSRPSQLSPDSIKLSKASLSPRFQRHFHATSYAMVDTRAESDAFGVVQVPTDKYWGAQTERSLENFRINQPQDRMQPPIIKAFGILKGAAATVNMQFGLGTLCFLLPIC